MSEENKRDKTLKFNWSLLGDIEEGRPNLGRMTFISMYRLMMFTLRDVLMANYGAEQADKLLFEAGKLAGEHFYENVLKEKSADFNEFIAELEHVLEKYKMGILRVEKVDLENMSMILTIAEDLDCSGLPVIKETVCNYDEGFLKGILYKHTGKSFKVKEIDCWGTGDRVCRFDIKQEPE